MLVYIAGLLLVCLTLMLSKDGHFASRSGSPVRLCHVYCWQWVELHLAL